MQVGTARREDGIGFSSRIQIQVSVPSIMVLGCFFGTADCFQAVQYQCPLAELVDALAQTRVPTEWLDSIPLMGQSRE